jgi:signal transduction histidine kinase
VNWVERQLERLRTIKPIVVDGLLAVVFFVIGVTTVLSQELVEGQSEPRAPALLTVAAAAGAVAVRRIWPLEALVVGCTAVFVHILSDWPEGSVPMTVLLLTYTVAAHEPARRAFYGLAVVYATLILLGVTDTPGLDTLGVVGNLAVFTVAWTIGIALRARRDSLESRVREADERANVERQAAARALAEERLRIAQELHDVVAHSMSVIAVQAGAGAHVLDDRPEQARAALEAISTTARGTLTEMRRLLGVLRDDKGERSHAPAPGLADLPQLIEDVRAAGVPVSLHVSGDARCEPNGGIELSAYRVVQEALTNVMKHAGSTTQVDVSVRHEPSTLTVEVVDDGRGAAGAVSTNGTGAGGHGHVGMRERVEVWGGELLVGPRPGGGYRVSARLPYGDEP